MKASFLKGLGRFPFLGTACAMVLFGILGVAVAAADSTPCSIPPPTDTWSPAPPASITTNFGQGSPLNIGNVFVSNVSGQVCALGMYAGNDATYTNPEIVGLYLDTVVGNTIVSATLLTYTTVTDTDPVYDGYHWASASAPVIAGDVYTVVDFTNGNGYGYGAVPTNNWGTFESDDLASSASDPTITQSAALNGPTYYGGNALLSPEPSSLLLLASGLLSLAGVARRKLRSN